MKLKWIDIKKRKPKIGQHVLVTDGELIEKKFIYNFDFVSYWMPWPCWPSLPMMGGENIASDDEIKNIDNL